MKILTLEALSHFWSNIKTFLETNYAKKTAIPSVVNNLTSTSTSAALSAAQGKALNEKISSIGSPIVDFRPVLTEFNSDGSISETDASSNKRVTTFGTSSIVQTLYDSSETVLATHTVTFTASNTIEEVYS